MNQRRMQHLAANAEAVNGPVTFEARPSQRSAWLLHRLLCRVGSRNAGNAEDQARLLKRLQREQ
jgi:hypothetical protein